MAIEDELRDTRVTPWTRRLVPVREYVATENASAAVLLAATVAAVVWANSATSGSYGGVWDTEVALSFGSAELTLDLRHWVNDGLMVFFFFVVGLEIRREFDMGELRERRRVATPVLAAIGGMVAPALIYVAINAGDPSVRGWGIVMGTDTAFALAVLMLVGGAAPRARAFLLTLVIVDDIVALAVIALAYTEDLSFSALGVALGLYGVILAMRASGVRHGVPYFLVGLGMWLAMLASGVHATIAGVAVGLLATAYPPSRQQLSQAGAIWRLFREEPTPEYARTASRTLALTISPNERLQHLFHPWTSFVIVPLFALANAGVELEGEVLRDAASEPILIGIVVGLVVGKPLGILGATWLVSRSSPRSPPGPCSRSSGACPGATRRRAAWRHRSRTWPRTSIPRSTTSAARSTRPSRWSSTGTSGARPGGGGGRWGGSGCARWATTCVTFPGPCRWSTCTRTPPPPPRPPR